MKGGRSHYAGPGKGSDAPKSKSKLQLGHTAKQAGHGKVNPNPKGHTKAGLPVSSRQVSNKRVSIHDMTF